MPGVMLDEDAGEAFERAEHGAVDHYRHGLLTVRRDIEGAEPPRQIEIDLDGAALPVPPDGVAQHIFELRPVEGALSRVQLIAEAGSLNRALQRRFSLVPHLIRTDPLSRPVREFDTDILEPEVAIDREH